MIARKIINAAKTLSNIKHHVEPAVWKVMSRAVNELIESAEQVRVLEKKLRVAGSDPPSGVHPEITLAEAGDLLENIAAALRRGSKHPAPKTRASM